MKTTVEINDNLLQRAKRLAAERNETLKAILEAALRQFLDNTRVQGTKIFNFRKRTFKGRGVQANVDESDWSALRARAYEGRGG
jgi:predicted transcriptional regulator